MTIFELASDETAPRRAREGLMPLGATIGAETLSDLKMIVTELVTNSVKFGPGRPISVTIDSDSGDLIKGEVLDEGSGRIEMRADRDPEGAGLGLMVVDTLASAWGVRPGTTTVWFELRVTGV